MGIEPIGEATPLPIKKAWSKPALAALDIRATSASGTLWQFVPSGDFWKREQLVLDS
ncbi:hypothetical protein [Cohnella sp. REN36]|uniref:hypothetical protein n=1 Tax=Cohnella sp. REN36 TaxID=2887347 RepID=UPI001D151148|nr:hypothetical protein [Cohnella sp. REN36]MCC3372638.1 hypothetical protein [Cohnella sp. REN36]